MKVYVAASFGEKERAREMMTRLRREGVIITFDWTTCDSTPYKDAKDYHNYMQDCAFHDLRGVQECNVLVALASPVGKGMYCEMGAALAHRRPVVLVGGSDIVNVFFHDPRVVRVAFDEQAVDYVRNLQARGS
jgi:hypothetical protein